MRSGWGYLLISGYPELAIGLVVAAIFTAYGIAGGLVAAVVTDFVQGFFIVILSFLLLPFGFAAVGGFAGLREKVPANFFQVFSSAGGELAPFTVAMLVVSGLVGITVQPPMMAVASSGKTELNCRIGWTYGNFIKRICTIGWTLTGLLAAVLYPGLDHANREQAFGLAVVGLLPAGLVGLMVASLLATVMSTCSAFMVDGAALFVRNVYKPFLAPGGSDLDYLKVARWTSFAITLLGFALGLWLPSMVSATVHFVTILPFVGVSFWVGIVWRRANRWGAWCSTTISAIVFLVCRAAGLDSSWASLWSLLFGFTAIKAASVVTRPEPEANLERIFHYIDSPVQEEERRPGIRPAGEGGRVKPGAEAGDKRLIRDLLGTADSRSTVTEATSWASCLPG
jgi:Na+/proline symporter